MITITDLDMRFGNRILFKNVNLQIMPGQRHGLIGANGSGKSTFLKILSDLEVATSGTVQRPNKSRLGCLAQDHFQFEDKTALEAVIMGKPELYNAMQSVEALFEKEEFTDAEGEELANLECLIGELDGYSAEADASQLLEGLGLEQHRHQLKMKELSGGYKLRVLLAQVLFSDPEILLLDEPTNHLDIYSIRWLESYLMKYKGALVVISHDRDFVNGVSTHILDVDFGTIRCYKGNYDRYLKQVEEESIHREAAIVKSEKRKGDLQEFVDKFKAKASKAKQAQSKMRMIEKLDNELDDHTLQPSSRRRPGIKFNIDIPSGATPLTVTGVDKAFGEKVVLQGVSFEVDRGECLALLGANGIGKSTLLKIVTHNLKADQGEFKWGHQVSVSYFPQDIEAEVQGEGTVLEWIHGQCPKNSDGELRKALARSLFSGDDSSKKVSTLSGGERARLILARMFVEASNVLIFDEPTNHLDFEAIEALCSAIEDYPGTVLLVSHNRWFVSRLAKKVLELKHDETIIYEGGYEQMLARSGEDHLSREVSLKKKAPEKQIEKLDPNTLKKERNKFSQLEKDIVKIEGKIEKVNLQMLAEGFYDTLEDEKRDKVLSQHENLKAELEKANQEWEQLAEVIEANS